MTPSEDKGRYHLNVRKLVGMLLLGLGVAGLALANPGAPVPEIDPGSVVSALTLLSAALLLRGRRRA